MSVTMKDFVAEAADIRTHLAGKVPTSVLTDYINARCITLHAANPRFDKGRFEWACVNPTEGK